MADLTLRESARTTLTRGGKDYTLLVCIVAGLVLSLFVRWAIGGEGGFPKAITENIHFVDWVNQAKDWVQANVKWLTRALGSGVKTLLETIEEFLWFAPWPAVALALVLPALALGGLRLAIFTLLGVMFWGSMKMWDDAMTTLALMSVSVALSVLFGVMIGIWCSQSERVNSIFQPILDTMQTMPSLVYLIPMIFLFGVGPHSAAFAIMIYAMPPAIRLTNLGIRQVPASTIEAALSYGSTRNQVLWKVQLPQAMPSIMMGVNQTIMMALALAVLAVLVGAGGLGAEVWKPLQRLQVGRALEGGLAIVIMAIIFDRLSMALAKPHDAVAAVDKTEMRFRLLPQSWARFEPAKVVERGLDAIWQAVAKLATAIVAAVALPFGSTAIGEWMRRHVFFVFSVLLIAALFAINAWVWDFGSYPKAWRFTIREPIDDAVKWLTQNDAFISVTYGIRYFIYIYLLQPLTGFFGELPWWFVLIGFFAIGWASKSVMFGFWIVVALFFCGAVGIWDLTMYTLAFSLTAVAVCILIGLPLGILGAYSKTAEAIMKPVLDLMQTMPPFVYLVPVLMFFGANSTTAIIATVVYAVPPMIRMTTLGLRQLPEEINEVSNSFGSNPVQTLFKVKLPMASPSLMVGVNQAIIMALAMQVVTPLVNGGGLGKEVFNGVMTSNTGKGLMAGIGIVLLAIILDRLTQAWTQNQRRALGL